MADSKPIHNWEYFDFFQSKLSGLSAEAALKYRRTLADLDFFLTGNQLKFQDLSWMMVADWTTELFRQGFAKTTVIRHLNILSSLVNSAAKKGLLPHNDSPRRLARLLTDSSDFLPVLLKERPFGKCLGLLRKSVGCDGDRSKYVDLLTVSVLNGARPINEIIYLKKTDIDRLEPMSRKIIEQNSDPNREYVFDLRQSYHTPRHIYSAVTDGLRMAFESKMSVPEMDADKMACSLWAACAMRSGATASEALALTEGVAPYSVPAFCEPASIDTVDKAEWIKPVNQLLASDMPRWFAMHLRKGVSFDSLRREISEKIRPIPELFYPCETITKFVGNKKTVTDHPVISQTAFFKSHPENVMPMFAAIGDKAWCYRMQNSPTAPYAVIPSEEMKRFQAAVGIFTSDIDIHPLGELSPKPGESVVIIMAGYGNREGKVEEVIDSGADTAIFRVKLSTDQGYEWRMNVDARQIQRVVGR